AGEHERLFGDLAIGKAPTPLAHRYFVMRWDFSKINPDPPPWGVNANVSSRLERLGNEINGYLNTSIETFLIDYRGHLPEPPRLGGDPFHNFERLLATIRQTPYRLYLLIDEYDNFANEILTDDADVYRSLVRSDGPFKYLFKWVKGLMAGSGLERLFITGVSPLVMSDVTSGMNIARNVYLKPALADLCGFTEAEVDELIAAVLRERGDCELSADDTTLMMREWYNGYRFALGVPERVYNPTLVFYFLLHLLEEGSCPDGMLDSNLAADEGKLEYLARLSAEHEVAGQEDAGQTTLIDLIRKDQPLEVRQLLDRFTLKELVEHSAQDTSFFGSYLFYFG
ncbi:MAG: AAA family ATPase, partial [bacterium]|nr:AAA family ATPase [bacterium]